MVPHDQLGYLKLPLKSRQKHNFRAKKIGEKPNIRAKDKSELTPPPLPPPRIPTLETCKPRHSLKSNLDVTFYRRFPQIRIIRKHFRYILSVCQISTLFYQLILASTCFSVDQPKVVFARKGKKWGRKGKQHWEMVILIDIGDDIS
jgi:hypothetical protein